MARATGERIRRGVFRERKVCQRYAMCARPVLLRPFGIRPALPGTRMPHHGRPLLIRCALRGRNQVLADRRVAASRDVPAIARTRLAPLLGRRLRRARPSSRCSGGDGARELEASGSSSSSARRAHHWRTAKEVAGLLLRRRAAQVAHGPKPEASVDAGPTASMRSALVTSRILRAALTTRRRALRSRTSSGCSRAYEATTLSAPWSRAK